MSEQTACPLELCPLDNLQQYVEAQLSKHHVPAVSVAIWRDGQLYQGAAGNLNQETGVAATTESIFRIASITKVLTTSLVMQLVDEGKVDLDTPVKQYLRDFQIADPEATQIITVRQLLNHTNGIAGDFFPDDLKHQGNLIARYVDRCSLLPMIHPPGEMYSYSNAAFAIVGRMIEVIRGISWAQAVEDYIFKPLGLEHSITDPNKMIRYRAAVGHIPEPNSHRLNRIDQDNKTLGTAPGGSTMMMSAADLVTFARAHMEGGLSASGERWLSAESVAAMRTPLFEKPRLKLKRRMQVGLGWGITDYPEGGIQTVGHTGSTGGCLSVLLTIPKQNIAFSVLTNGYRSSAMDGITRDLLMALTGVDNAEDKPVPVELEPAQLQKLVGRYESLDTVIDISYNDKQLAARIVYNIDPKPPLCIGLQAVDGDRFAYITEQGLSANALTFLNYNDEGKPQYIFNGGRLNPRVSL